MGTVIRIPTLEERNRKLDEELDDEDRTVELERLSDKVLRELEVDRILDEV